MMNDNGIDERMRKASEDTHREFVRQQQAQQARDIKKAEDAKAEAETRHKALANVFAALAKMTPEQVEEVIQATTMRFLQADLETAAERGKLPAPGGKPAKGAA